MIKGSLTLRQLPGTYVEIACTKCERRGRLLRDKLIAQYGAEAALPDLRNELASSRG
jgi:hypothetical protein